MISFCQPPLVHHVSSSSGTIIKGFGGTHCIMWAVRGCKRQKTQAEGLEGRVTNCPSWPRLCSTKSPASRKTPPSQANQDNCSTSKGRERKRQTLPKPGVLSHSTLLVMENPTQEALRRVSLLQTAVSPRWWCQGGSPTLLPPLGVWFLVEQPRKLSSTAFLWPSHWYRHPSSGMFTNS